MAGFLSMMLDNIFGMKRRPFPSEEQIRNYLREESEVLRAILQDSEEIVENLTDDENDVVSDNESDK